MAQWLAALAAMLLPFVIIHSFPKFFHSSDVDDFFRWSQAWAMGWRNVYINCDRCNYPLLGTFLSGGVMSSIHIADFSHLETRFRYYLAIVDALNILAIWFILIKLEVNNAPLWAGVIGLLPSSWLGASVWGQIDGMGQLFILLFFIALIWFNSKERPTAQLIIFSALAGFILSLMLLTKQLIYFSMFALGAALLVNFILASKNIKSFLISLLASGLAFALPVIIIDANLNLKQPYFSHLQYVLETGSKHGDTISYIGINIWSFFTKDLLGSSHAAIPIKVDTIKLFSVVPFSTGIFLFLSIVILLSIIFGKYIWRQYSLGARRFDQRAIFFIFIYLALVNLSFNLTLTGVHERYLYHFYPFIIIACLGLMPRSKYFNRIMLGILLFGAITYGAFLYAYLTLHVRATSQNILQVMSGSYLILFGYLIYSALNELKSDRS